MSDVALRVEQVSKVYRLGRRNRHQTLRESLTDAVAQSVRRIPARLKGLPSSRPAQETFWALKEVTFGVAQGEVLGIIGRNGAGKSTLLKILSRITEPTQGRVQGYGRVGSLLEVGTGFHPELTGRENIYLNGAILGMRKSEIRNTFDEIVDFAEIETFLDMPVKRYSSGMYVRLAFAVAAHLESEILLVDEVLAVGDAAFQKKCLGKMEDVTNQGRTVLFVSHNLLAVQDLCNRAIWLQEGRLVEEGPPGRVVSHYVQTSFSALTEQRWEDVNAAPGSDDVRLRRACVRPTEDAAASIDVCTPFAMEFEYLNLKPGAYLNLSLQLYNEQGILVFESAPVHEPVWQGNPMPVGLFKDVCHVPGNLLNDGMYRVVLHLVKDQGTLLHKEDDILIFEVHDAVENRAGWHGAWDGAVRPILAWSTELIQEGKMC